MDKILQTMRYLSTGFTLMLGIAFGSLIGNALVTNLIFHLTDRSNLGRTVGPLTVPLEFTAVVFALIIGLILFLANFKVVIANGVSRRTFFLANLPVALLAAAVLALMTTVVVLVYSLFWPVMPLSLVIYPLFGWPGLLFLQWALYFMAIAAGWLISVAYYRASVAMRWVITLVPLVLITQLRAIDTQSGGAVDAFVRTSFGLGNPSNPYQGGMFLLAYGVLLAGVVYLLIRRAPVKV
jgi:hypothetical protein